MFAVVRIDDYSMTASMVCFNSQREAEEFIEQVHSSFVGTAWQITESCTADEMIDCLVSEADDTKATIVALEREFELLEERGHVL